jgi:RNA polymerase sigma-70 factor (ECF subfamily)
MAATETGEPVPTYSEASPAEDAATPAVDDGALVRAVAAGSSDALAVLYDRYVDSIFATARRSTSDRGAAEEVVQETFLALWDRAETFDPAMGSVGGWLRTIARNRSVDRLRAAARRPTLVAYPISPASGEPDAASLDRIATPDRVVGGSLPTPVPEMELVSAETRRAIQAALVDLPDDERTAIVLAYSDGLTQTEIAERLGWPLGTVKTRTRRALTRLRSALADER